MSDSVARRVKSVNEGMFSSIAFFVLIFSFSSCKKGDQEQVEKQEQVCKDGEKRECYTGSEGTKGIGECKAGTQECKNGQWGECQGQVLPTAEICDAKDNDCNGQVDDGFNVGQVCEVGVGECKRAGQYVCKTDGTGTYCMQRLELHRKRFVMERIITVMDR